MAKKEIVIIADYSQQEPLTMRELCEICGISSDFMHDLVTYEIIHPVDAAPETFDLAQLQRVKTVLRLQRDLEINLAGAAVVLDLLDQLEELRAQMELIHKHHL